MMVMINNNGPRMASCCPTYYVMLKNILTTSNYLRVYYICTTKICYSLLIIDIGSTFMQE